MVIDARALEQFKTHRSAKMISNTKAYRKLFAAVTSKDKLKLAGLPTQITTHDARSLLHTATNNGHDAFGLTAQDARANNNFALRKAAENGHVEVLTCLHDAFGLSADDAQADGNYALRMAAYNGHLEVLEYLHDTFGLTADDARDNNNWALRLAAKNGHLEVLKYLHDAFGLTADDAEQCNALSIAESRWHLKVAKELKDNWQPNPFNILDREEARVRAAITALAYAETPSFYAGLEFSPYADSGFEAICGICMGAMLHVCDAVLFSGKEHALAVTGCGHVFHTRCVEAMRTTATACPMCRGSNMAAPGNTLVLVPNKDENIDAFIARARPEIAERRRHGGFTRPITS